jgi:hypothetical protein
MVQWILSLKLYNIYDQDILAVKIAFGKTGDHQKDAITVQFPTKIS